jgi:hypothetical protein
VSARVIDASQPTFRFYSEGVYKDKLCKTGKVGDWHMCNVCTLLAH